MEATHCRLSRKGLGSRNLQGFSLVHNISLHCKTEMLGGAGGGVDRAKKHARIGLVRIEKLRSL